MRKASKWTTRALVAIAVTVAGAAPPAGAGLTAESCQARKLKEQGKYLACRASESAKALRGKPADLAACQARFADVAAKLNSQAAASGVQCRYRDEGDGTVTDLDTGLQWEQKTDDASIHDATHSARPPERKVPLEPVRWPTAEPVHPSRRDDPHRRSVRDSLDHEPRTTLSEVTTSRGGTL